MSNKGRTITVIGTGASAIRALSGEVQEPIKYPISARPVIQGPHGRAWLCDESEGLRQKGLDPKDNASLGHWLIEAPWAHPAWHSYSLVLVHLRPMPGKETLIYLDGATHEIWLAALDPSKDRNPMLKTGIVDCWLRPMNFAAQFIEITDALAKERITNAVQAICDGRLNPDTDARQQWIALFGNNMQKDRPNRREPRVFGANTP